MIKKLLFVLLLVTSVTVSAQTEHGLIMGENHYVDIRDFVYSQSQDPDSELSRIITHRTAPTAEKTLWIDRINNLPDYMRAFYDKYCALASEVLAGGSNCLSEPFDDPVNTMNFGSTVATHIPIVKTTRRIGYTFPADVVKGNPNAKQQYALNAVRQEIENNLSKEYDQIVWAFLPYVNMSISYDMPEIFWIANGYSWCNMSEYTYNLINEPDRDSVEINYYILYSLKLRNYDFRIDEFTSNGAVSAAVREYNGLVENILADVPKTTRYDQIRYLNNWLTKNNAYSSALQTGNVSPIVWSAMSALRGTNGANGPVCEGYARAFKILCDKLGIPCVLAVGNAYGYVGATPGGHMWNEVMMNDDKWYAVDVTWNDPLTGGSSDDPKESGLENEDWLLLGKNTVVSRYPETLTFGQSHPNSVLTDQNQSSYWDYSCESFITDNKFDPVTGLDRIRPAQNDDVIYSILGVRINKKVSELEPGVYIINGRKFTTGK